MTIVVYPLYIANKHTVSTTQQFQQRMVRIIKVARVVKAVRVIRIIRVVGTEKCRQFFHPLILGIQIMTSPSEVIMTLCYSILPDFSPCKIRGLQQLPLQFSRLHVGPSS